MRYYLFVTIISVSLFSCDEQEKVSILNEHITLSFQKTEQGWQVESLTYKDEVVGNPSGLFKMLWSENIQKDIDSVSLPDFPFPRYYYLEKTWPIIAGPIMKNSIGKLFSFYADSLELKGDSIWLFKSMPKGDLKTKFYLKNNTITSEVNFRAKARGYYSFSSPELVSFEKEDISWGMVPGYFQGKRFEKDFVKSVIYGQGIPDFPYLCGDRTVTTPMSIIDDNQRHSLAVVLKPEQTRRLTDSSGNLTHRHSRSGFGLVQKDEILSPHFQIPLLSHEDSYLEVGEEFNFTLEYVFNESWNENLHYAMQEVYQIKAGLQLKQNRNSFTKRISKLVDYALSDETSKWVTSEFEGQTIGAQKYNSAVAGSDKDATKNSDIGAMWMMNSIMDIPDLAEKRIPVISNFKKAQIETKNQFFNGAPRGQYYLTKSKTFVEEWGEYTEPIGVTYYNLCDIGNILNFEPENEKLKEVFRLGAERLLQWQKEDGSWEIAYQQSDESPIFTDQKDYRPTFYGLVVAYQILKDEHYLKAAQKGADWLIENSIKKGKFLGVCGDMRFVKDFAIIQQSKAFLELWKMTKEERYKTAAFRTAELYLTHIYSHPIPSNETIKIKDKKAVHWQYTLSGLSYEHGGAMGSAARLGPILLASHAGYFIELGRLFEDDLFIDLARNAVIGRDAFINPNTYVSSYYWSTLNRGASGFPHHAWWQIGWMMDYLVNEITLRSNGDISFPKGFMTSKVGPHSPYGFAKGLYKNEKVSLHFIPDILKLPPSWLEFLVIKSDNGKKYLIILNNSSEEKTQLLHFNHHKNQHINLSPWGIDILKL